jgi:hypothetical protein
MWYTRCIGKFLACYCCNRLCERRWERKPRSHFHKLIASVCHVTLCCECTLFLHECFFNFMFHFACDRWQNRATFFKPGSGFSMALTFHGQLSVSSRWWTFKVTKPRPNTENIERTLELIQEDHHGTIHEIADTVGISYGVCQEILTENLNMCSIATGFVPWLLTNDQKHWRIDVYLEIREKANETQNYWGFGFFLSSRILGPKPQ